MWKKGVSIHRQIDGVKDGYCCPDFSCCKPNLLAIYGVRCYYISHPEDRDKFNMHFLAELLKHEKIKATILS